MESSTSSREQAGPTSTSRPNLVPSPKAPSELPKVSIKTTLPVQPFPPNSARGTIKTPRLVLRPLRENDLQALFEIRSQPEVMRTNPRGVPDTDIMIDTKPVLDGYLAPRDSQTFYVAICLRATTLGTRTVSFDGDKTTNGATTARQQVSSIQEEQEQEDEGKMIGLGGCHRLTSMFGWPVIGYMIRREYWGLGLTTEFLTAWLGLWKGLERGRGVFTQVDARTVVLVSSSDKHGARETDSERNEISQDDGGTDRVPLVPEQIVTWAVSKNVGSWRVMEKAGFEHLLTWKEPDLRDPRVEVELKAYRYFV